MKKGIMLFALMCVGLMFVNAQGNSNPTPANKMNSAVNSTDAARPSGTMANCPGGISKGAAACCKDKKGAYDSKQCTKDMRKKGGKDCCQKATGESCKKEGAASCKADADKNKSCQRASTGKCCSGAKLD
ncbi:MAG: hypothetical protein IPP77_12625 [Bacteroidetes bacterium]|nr:hypothetical protein [Bacteroidota bacterium]